MTALPCGGIHTPIPSENHGETRGSGYPTHFLAISAKRSARGNRCRPFAGTVESSNTVGYTKVNLDAGYNMIGVQFVQVGGQAWNASVVAELDGSMAGFNSDGDYVTEMKIWQNGTYTTYGWAGTSPSTYELDGAADLDNKWLNLDYEEEVNPLAGGAAFWVKAGTSGTLTILGEVPNGEVTIPLSAGYNMVANPLPATVLAADFGKLSANMEGFNSDGDYVTEMKVWENGTYTTYGWAGTSPSTYELDGAADLDNKWLNLDYEVTEGTVEVGHAVWIKAGSAGSITFNAD